MRPLALFFFFFLEGSELVFNFTSSLLIDYMFLNNLLSRSSNNKFL